MADRDFTNLVTGHRDESGAIIVAVYARQSGRYAVYATPDRIMVCFADDIEVQLRLRQLLLAVSDLRSEIAALQSYRTEASFFALRKLHAAERAETAFEPLPSVRSWNEQVAAAIVDALEGSTAIARRTLARVHSEILAERYSRGRLVYLSFAALAVAMVSLVAIAATRPAVLAEFGGDPAAVINVWRAVAAGALGAFFSIARAITGRTVRADNRAKDHVVDAVTRVTVGCIAALVLESLLDSGLLSLSLGGVSIGHAGDEIVLTKWPVTIVAGFLAGFSERLIPDLMADHAIDASTRRPADPPAGLGLPPHENVAGDPQDELTSRGQRA